MGFINYFQSTDAGFLRGVLSGLFVAFLLWIVRVTVVCLKKIINKVRMIRIPRITKIVEVYDNLDTARAQLLKDALNANKISIFSNQGTLFDKSDRDFGKLLKNTDTISSFRVLMLDPDSEAASIRARELKHNGYKERCRACYQEFKSNEEIQVVLHDIKLRYCLYFFDDILYLGFLFGGTHARDSQLWRIEKESCLYHCLYEQFYIYWKKYSIGIKQ